MSYLCSLVSTLVNTILSWRLSQIMIYGTSEQKIKTVQSIQKAEIIYLVLTLDTYVLVSAECLKVSAGEWKFWF